MKRANKDCSIYSDEFKRQVNLAHQKFFEKRGIDPSKIDGDFLYGSKAFRKFREDNPSWSPDSSAQPTLQSFELKNYNPPAQHA
jgi:hypothetical protein